MSGVEVAVALIGGLVVVATLVDVVVTVVGVSGGHGVVSQLVSRSMWRSALNVTPSRLRHDVLRMVGPAIFIAITLVWAALLIAGWVLVFWPDEALAAPDGAGPIGWWDRLDHAAALVFGGSTPLVESRSQPYGFMARLARFSGLGLSSFGLAYALPVVGAVVRMRRTANSIASVAGADGRIDTLADTDGRDSAVHFFLINISGEIRDASQSANAYPILPFFHSKEQSTSLSLQIARLDDFLRRRDPEHSPVLDSVCQPLARSIESLLEVIATRFLPTDTSLPDERGARRTAIIDAWCRREGWSRAETSDVARMSA